MKKLLIVIVGISLISCNKIQQEVVTKYLVFERFGEIELDTNFLKNRGFNERTIINYDKKGIVTDISQYKHEFNKGFVLQKKFIFKDNVRYTYDNFGKLESTTDINHIKTKTVESNDTSYIIHQQDTIATFQILRDTKDLIIRKVINSYENYLEFVERKYY